MGLDSAAISSSTLDDIADEEQIRARHVLSIVVVVAVVAFVLAGLAGLFGGTALVTIRGEDQTIEVEYPSMARAGMDMVVLVRITSEQQLPDEFDILLNETYVGGFEDLAILPEPDAQTATTPEGLRVTITTAPGAHSAWVQFAGRASDDWSPRFDADLRIDLGSGDPARLTFHTWRMP